MLGLSLSLSAPPLHPNHHFPSLRSPHAFPSKIFNFTSLHKFHQNYDPLRVSIDYSGGAGSGMKRKRQGGVVCYSAVMSPHNLQWVSTISSVVLMLAKGTAIHKSFLVPLFALQAPIALVSWIQGEYGIWIAFLALLVRLFFSFPGELELPFLTLLLVIVAPYQVANLRGTKEGVVLSLAFAAYLAFQHFSRAGRLQAAFDQGSIIATLAIICIVTAPCLLLI